MADFMRSMLLEAIPQASEIFYFIEPKELAKMTFDDLIVELEVAGLGNAIDLRTRVLQEIEKQYSYENTASTQWYGGIRWLARNDRRLASWIAADAVEYALSRAQLYPEPRELCAISIDAVRAWVRGDASEPVRLGDGYRTTGSSAYAIYAAGHLTNLAIKQLPEWLSRPEAAQNCMQNASDAAYWSEGGSFKKHDINTRAELIERMRRAIFTLPVVTRVG